MSSEILMQIINCCWVTDNIFGSWPYDDEGLEDLPSLMRRRLTPLGRKALRIVNKCVAKFDNKAIPWIVSCRHGDLSHRFNLLSKLAQEEMLSPTDFSMSVHNAIISMFSIATDNKNAHCALAGGLCSFETGLLESIALLNEKGGLVGYIYYDYRGGDKLNDLLVNDYQIDCFAMILGKGNNGIKIEYNKSNNTNSINNFNIFELLGYLKNDEKNFRIPVGGGEILFERILSNS